MAKYNYDKSVLKGLGVGDFLGEVKTRQAHIDKGENSIPTSVYNPNVLAAKLHPGVQFGKIAQIVEYADAKTFVIVPDEAKGCKELAYFRAGQYVSIELQFGGAYMCKPYTIASGPKNALGTGSYRLTVKRTPNGYASDYILDNWGIGTEITLSGPLGEFYYERLRDAKTVVALAGGSGITPFIAMAESIADGTEDFDLTILYGSRNHENILLKDKLDELEKAAGGKVKVVHVLSDDESEGYEHGFISAELIRKYAPDGDYSIFVCGPKAMYAFAEKEIAKLDLPRRRVRFELSGEYGDPTKDEAYPAGAAGKEFTVKVTIRGDVTEVKCRAEETLLRAMESAGIKVPSDCRSGQCGWCHSRLISGETYIPASADGRRMADKKFGWVHPCVTYPLSDIEIEVFPLCK